jgi:hypothetical protein
MIDPTVRINIAPAKSGSRHVARRAVFRLKLLVLEVRLGDRYPALSVGIPDCYLGVREWRQTSQVDVSGRYHGFPSGAVLPVIGRLVWH